MKIYQYLIDDMEEGIIAFIESTDKDVAKKKLCRKLSDLGAEYESGYFENPFDDELDEIITLEKLDELTMERISYGTVHYTVYEHEIDTEAI